MARMANALRLLPSRRPLSIILIVFAAIMVVLVGLALWNPWRLTILYPLGHQSVAIGVLTLAGAFLAATAVLMFADNGRKALIALVACLVAVPAFCVGLPALALAGVFKEAPVNGTLTMAASPGGRYVVVKSAFDSAAGRQTRLYVRTDSLFFGREAPTPLAVCEADPFDQGLPPEAVRFTSETTVAVPVQGEQDTTVVRFDPDTLVPERTVHMCASN
jgi:hypothetical protein